MFTRTLTLEVHKGITLEVRYSQRTELDGCDYLDIPYYYVFNNTLNTLAARKIAETLNCHYNLTVRNNPSPTPLFHDTENSGLLSCIIDGFGVQVEFDRQYEKMQRDFTDHLSLEASLKHGSAI